MISENHEADHHVSFPKFFTVIGLQLVAILALFRIALPALFLGEAVQPLTIVLWIVGLGLPLSLFEYLYHRYLLHSAVFPFMAAMHRAHTQHHRLTSVKAPVNPRDPLHLAEVTSEFPIEEPHQEESMMFPLYSMPIFAFVFVVLLGLPLKLLLPTQPIIISLLCAVTAYLVAYEVWHAILHLPFEKFWRPRMESRWTGLPFRHVYGFHLTHHWRPGANQAIVGFWGLALWDHAFRTHRRPARLPLDGATVTYEDAVLAKPLWPIKMLDGWQAGLYRSSRTFERFLARVFLRRNP